MSVKILNNVQVAYPKQVELLNRVMKIVAEYENDMSLAAAIGILELCKEDIKFVFLDSDE